MTHCECVGNEVEVRITNEAGATNPEELGEQLASLIDGASTRPGVLDRESFSTAVAIATVLIDNALAGSTMRYRAGRTVTRSRDRVEHHRSDVRSADHQIGQVDIGLVVHQRRPVDAAAPQPGCPGHRDGRG